MEAQILSRSGPEQKLLTAADTDNDEPAQAQTHTAAVMNSGTNQAELR